jgi:transcriptional antiterminator RfaH
MSVANARVWYVALTQSRAGLKAVGHLLRQGFGRHLPSCLKRRRQARRTGFAPLFPRYVFLSADLTMQRWRAIRSTTGVARLFCTGEAPSRVADAIIDGLKASQAERGFVCLPPRSEFRSEAVRVVEGVFASCLGLFEGMTNGERVTIPLDLLIGIDAIAAA